MKIPLITEADGMRPLYNFMKLEARLKEKIIYCKLSGTYCAKHFEPLLTEVTEQLVILYN